MQLKFKYVNKIRDFDTDLKFFMFDVSWQDEFHHDKVFSYFRNINVLYLVTVSVFYLLSHWPEEMFNNNFKIMTASCFKNEGCVYTGSWTKHYRILLCLMLSWDWQRKLVTIYNVFHCKWWLSYDNNLQSLTMGVDIILLTKPFFCHLYV